MNELAYALWIVALCFAVGMICGLYDGSDRYDR